MPKLHIIEAKISTERATENDVARVFIMWKKCKPYLKWIFITLAVGGLSALITGKDMNLYQTVKTPPLSPPSWLFPVAWSILYVLMAVSFTRIYTQRRLTEPDDRSALQLYVCNLILNFFWSIIFFKLRAFIAAFFWLCVLWGVILAMIINFRRTEKAAAYLLLPYLLWVSFAGYLNLAIHLLNR